MLLLERRKPLPQRAKFVLGKHFQLRILTRLGEIREGGKLVTGATQSLDPVDDRGQLAIFFRRFCEIGARETRASERIAQLRVAAEELIQMLLERCSHSARLPVERVQTGSQLRQ